jgi:hypothetical protein
VACSARTAAHQALLGVLLLLAVLLLLLLLLLPLLLLAVLLLLGVLVLLLLLLLAVLLLLLLLLVVLLLLLVGPLPTTHTPSPHSWTLPLLFPRCHCRGQRCPRRHQRRHPRVRAQCLLTVGTVPCVSVCVSARACVCARLCERMSSAVIL